MPARIAGWQSGSPCNAVLKLLCLHGTFLPDCCPSRWLRVRGTLPGGPKVRELRVALQVGNSPSRIERPKERLACGLVQVGGARAAIAAAQMMTQCDRGAAVAEPFNVGGGIEHLLVLTPSTYRDESHLVVDELADSAAQSSFVCIVRVGTHGRHHRVPGHFGRFLGSMNSPPKRALKSSAWLRWAKQNTIMSASSQRNECVRGHRDSGSQKSRIVT